MNTVLLKEVEESQIQKHPDFAPGDTLEVSSVIREGERIRTQVFKGIVIAIKGSGTRKTFTIRKISHGVGVEKIFPLHSPNVSSLKLIKKGNVARAKLYYMRDRVGRLAMKTGESELGDNVMIETETALEQKPDTADVKQEAFKEKVQEVKGNGKSTKEDQDLPAQNGKERREEKKQEESPEKTPNKK